MRQLVQVIDGRGVSGGRRQHHRHHRRHLPARFRFLEASGVGYFPQVHLADGIAQLAEHLGHNPELPAGSTIFTLGQQAER